MKHKTYICIGLLLSAICLYLGLREIHLEKLWEVLHGTKLWALPLLLLSLASFYWIKAYRWSLLLSPVQRVKSATLVQSILAGSAVNFLLFGWVGELMRSYYLSKKIGLRQSATLMSIFLERIIDILTILLLMGWGLAMAKQAPSGLVQTGWILTGVALAALLFVIFSVSQTDTCLRIVQKTTTWLPEGPRAKLLEQAKLGITGLHALANPGLVLFLLVSSVFQWLVMALSYYLALEAVGIEAPFYATFLLIALTIIGQTLPSSPGHVGVLEYCFIVGLKAYHVPVEQALGAAVIYHTVLYGSVIIAGVYILRNLGLSVYQASLQAEKQGS